MQKLQDYLPSFGAVDSNCPPHPIPVPLSSPLPPIIQTSLSRLEQFIEGSLNTTSVVSIPCPNLLRIAHSSFLFRLQPGISASLVYMGSEICSKGFGVKSKTGPSSPPDHHTIFRIGSISKVFAVCLCVLTLQMAVLIDNFEKLLEIFSLVNPVYRPIICSRP